MDYGDFRVAAPEHTFLLLLIDLDRSRKLVKKALKESMGSGASEVALSLLLFCGGAPETPFLLLLMVFSSCLVWRYMV